MGDAVYVTFGADSSELEATLASANAAVRANARELAALARQQAATGASAESDLGQHMLAVAAHLAENREGALKAKEALSGVGKTEGGEQEREMLFFRMGESLKNMVSPVVELKGHIGELVEVFAAAFAVERIADWVAETTEAMEKVEQESHKLGISMESVQQLQAISTLSGVSYDDMASQLERLQLQLARTAEKSSPAAAALRALGINIAEFRTASIDRQLDLLAEAVSHFADGATKTGALQALGRGFADLAPVLDKGKEGLDELRRTAQDTGYALSSDLVEGMAQTREQISALSLSWSATWRQMAADSNSSAQAIVGVLKMMVDQLHSGTTEGGLFSDAMKLLGWAVQETAQFLAETILIIENLDVEGDIGTRMLIEIFKTFGKVVADIFKSLGAGVPAFFTALVTAGKEAVLAVGRQFSDLGTVISDTLHLNFSGAKHAFGQMGSDAEAAGSRIAGAFKGAFDFSNVTADQQKGMLAHSLLRAEGGYRLKQNDDRGQKTYNAIWGIPNGPSKGEAPAEGAPKPQVPQMNLGGAHAKSGAKDAAQAVQDAFDGDVKAAQHSADDIETTLDGLLKQHKITMQQWLSQTVGALDHEQDAVQEAADKALASSTLSSHQKIAIAQRESDQIDAIAKKIAKDQEKAAEAAQKPWDDAFKTINDAFTSQISGLLRGTENFGTAMRSVLASLTEDVIKFFVDWGLQAAENEIKQLALNSGLLASTTATVAGQTGAMGAGVAAEKTMNATAAQSDAGKAAAGAYAATTSIPIIGPMLAPAAAAAAYAGTLAFASYDIGAWSVPHDQLAMVHHNELIMPAAQAGAFRSMLSGEAGAQQGGVSIAPTTHFHVSAIDGASVGQWFRDNQHPLMRSINDAVRQGAHLGMRRLATG